MTENSPMADASPRLDATTIRPAVWGLVALTLLAFAPLWWTYFTWTWRDGHYQYFPLLILMIGVLAKMRWPAAVEAATWPRTSVLMTGAGVIVVLVLAAHLLNSPWVGIVATALASCVLTYGLVGSGGLWVMAPVLALWLLAIPLPMNYDDTLIFKMQFFASQLASLLLDGAGIRHLREGVVLITEKSQYMTEEACSGVRSLFSSLAVVAVYAVVSHHRLVRTCFNLVQTVFWVLIGNAIRVAACVVLADNVSPWYASGAGHEMLSMVVFAFILGMVASTDQIVGVFCQRQLGIAWFDEGDDEIHVEDGGEMVARSGLRLPSLRRPEVMGSDGEMKESRAERLARARGFHGTDSMGDDGLEQAGGLLGGLSRKALIAIGALLLPIIGLGWFAAMRDPDQGIVSMDQMPRLAASTETDLPADLAGWSRSGFQHVERVKNGLQAPDSYTWGFQRDGVRAVLSVDCPWAEWHNLNVCYVNVGWVTSPDYFVESPTDVPFNNLSFSELTMSKRDGSSGYVMFTVVDRNRSEMRDLDWRESLLQPVQAVEILVDSVSRRFGFGGPILPNLPGSTIQLYSDRSGSYTDEQIASLQALFFAARKELLDGPRWAGAAR
ncbi:exosortase U [Rubripirellula reticaptiva]|uniref:Transmembrane exosortase n=1 Tax=Rubripirellula reticaptiva TaxID=2528013 RepID=A0A5C6F3U1_9BACT|nr:exosortase U [Rubripirellula reticaptiva]TWU55204.1 Transmembrane exosortase [Rubripirellula reticaptiva]